MNVSLNWLKEYVPLSDDLDIREFTEKLTMSGSKVEKYEKFGRKVTGVFAGKVIENEVQNGYSIVKLDLGNKIYTAIAKIPDLTLGDIVPVALPGADIIAKTVKEDTINGVKSECMICHILDLGLTKELFPLVKSSGLIVFPDSVELGSDVSEVLGLGDYLIEFEITPNRADCMSVEGLAREIAVTLNLPCKKLWQDTKPEFKRLDSVDNIKVNIETENCSKYVLSVAKNIEIKSSPFEMQLKLIKSGYSVINNIVDITNFVMLEMGQPLHAFDRDKLTNNIVIKQSEEMDFTTLDKQVRKLNSNNMVITNGKETIAIAGVMGGLDSSINENTKTIAIEAASFVRGSIRNTSKKLLLRTDASSKYEKGLPSMLTEYAMNRVCNLINELKIGEATFSVVDVDNSNYKTNIIDLEYDRIIAKIGMPIPKEEVIKILNNLNLKVNTETEKVTVPYYRTDVEITEDLTEEVSRIYGYDKLNSTLPVTGYTFGGKTTKQLFEDKLKELSLALGYNEIYTYTFFSKETLNRAIPESDLQVYNLVKLENPLSKDFEYMRTTTVPHMLEALERNNSKKNLNVKLFDMGKVFLNAENIAKNELCKEELVLTLGIYGDNVSFYDVKDDILSIFAKFKIKTEIKRSEELYLHPGISADIMVNNKTIATIGKINPKKIQNYNLPENTYIATLNVDNFFECVNTKIKYKELPKFPAVERDIAFVISDEILSSEIITAIKNLDTNIVENVKLFDVYKGNQIKEGFKSMAYRIILRSEQKTLDENQISEYMDKLFYMLENTLSAELRK